MVLKGLKNVRPVLYIRRFLISPFVIMFVIFLLPGRTISQDSNSLSLLECINIALEKNPVINSARENLLKAKLGIKDAYSSMLPNVNAALDYSHSEGATPLIPPELFNYSAPKDDYSFGIELMQPLYNKGKYFTLREQADINIYISNMDLDNTRQEIIFEVISAYIGTLKAEEMINIAKESRDRLAEHLRVTGRRFDVGLVAKNDVLRAEMELANAESDLIHVKKDLLLNYETLQKLLLMERKSFNTQPFNFSWDIDKDVNTYVNSAYETRSDYQQTIKQIQLAETGITLAKKDFLPFVSLFAQYKRTGEEFFPDDDVTTVGGKIEIPIYEAGTRHVKLRSARHDLTLAQNQEIELKREIKVQVIEAYLQVEDLNATLKAIDKQIEHAQENFRITQLRYNEGEATNLDVIDANLLFVKAKTDFSTYSYDLIQAKMELLKNIGDLGIERLKGMIAEGE